MGSASRAPESITAKALLVPSATGIGRGRLSRLRRQVRQWRLFK